MIKLFRFAKLRTGKKISGLLDMIEYMNHFGSTSKMKMVEIGSYVGDSTILFAKYFREVISIDPYKNTYPNTEHLVRSKFAPWPIVYKEFIKRTQFLKNITQIKKTSDEAIVDLVGNNFNFVYIDGNHLFRHVVSDIKNYSNLIEDGFIGGHDYKMSFPEVIAGVKYTLGVPDFVFKDSSWIKFIGKTRELLAFKNNTKMV